MRPMPRSVLRRSRSLAVATLALASLARPAPGLGQEVATPPRHAIQGRVTYDGSIPRPIPVPEAGLNRAVLEVDPMTKGLRGAVIWLEGVPAEAAAVRPAPAGVEPVLIDQQNFFFVPHVVAVEAGRPVEFRNRDNANHGVHATAIDRANTFNVVTPTGGRHVQKFAASKTPVAIGCPLHPAMAAWIYVFDHPFFAVTDEGGRFRLPPVPPGPYTLQVRQPDGGFRHQQAVTVTAEQAPAPLVIPFHEADRKGGDSAR